ncbi:outer membrane beta-barrel family protein [Mucilaginibacter segetis]|uniref:TonB-dependent receptor n=1 Tax=Mucilaginibacter segetis TaxID=2793071 RepID=A0A934PW83_9SPHI|nr:outer membrane beta-barrel family protein [Mucilaginibacter segetis]MBK0380550.1 TonB-dependent receptor [Mucilaginibacter segetis]
MKVSIGCLFIVLVSGIFNFSYAQNQSSVIRGNVLMQNNQPADAATVILLNAPDSSIVLSALVNEQGSYEFPEVKAGSYLLLATRLGYQKTYSTVFSIGNNQTVTIPAILLTADKTQLKEVAIVARKPFIEVRPGKLIINPGASIIADGKSALDILSQSPGVRVDNNDNISISARQNALILVDGKTTNLSGPDLASLLKSMPGNNIERIEVIKSATAKYDAAAGGIINIVLKKGKNIGTNGTFNTTTGYGRYYKLGSGITFNNRTKNINIFGNYNIDNRKNYHDLDNDRIITYAGSNAEYNSMYTSIQKSISHNFGLGADFTLDKNNTIGFIINGLVNDNDFSKDNKLTITNNGILDSSVLATSTINRDFNYVNYNINYSGKLDTSGKTLAFNLTYSPNKRISAEYINNTFLNAAGHTYRNPLLLQNLSPSDRHNWTALLQYSNPLPGNSKIEAGLKYSATESDNDQIFGPLVNGKYISDPNFTNRFIYKQKISAAYINYSLTLGKFDIEAGLRAEHTQSTGNSLSLNSITADNYTNLFPSFITTYRKNDKNEFSLTFSRGIERPAYESLNPFLYYIDLYRYNSGNPYLKPSYSNNIHLSHTYDQIFTTDLYVTLYNNAMFPFYEQNDSTKVNVATSRNLGKVGNYGVNFNGSFDFFAWWNGYFDADLSYQHYKAYPQNGNLNKGTGDLILSTSQTFKLLPKLSANISGDYETATFYGINHFKPAYGINTGVSTQLFKKAGKLSLILNDVFNTRRDRAYTTYLNLDQHIKDKKETRIITLNFSYRFGKTSVKGASRHSTGNEVEQSRMNASSN